MADIAISSADYIRPLRSPWGQPEMDFAPEVASQTFVYGDVLQLTRGTSTSSHRVSKASTSDSTITSTAIVGVAAAAASSVQDTPVPYYTAAPYNKFWARTRGGTLAAANVGAHYGLFYDSSAKVTLIDLGNTQSTSLFVCVTRLIDAIGDSGGAVEFKFGAPNGSTNTFGMAVAR